MRVDSGYVNGYSVLIKMDVVRILAEYYVGLRISLTLELKT